MKSKEGSFADEFQVVFEFSVAISYAICFCRFVKKLSLCIFNPGIFCLQSIPMTSPDHSCNYGKQTDLKKLNRFKNIVPCKLSKILTFISVTKIMHYLTKYLL